MLIDASHNEETRVVVLESKKVEDFDFESLNKLQLAGNIYLAKVTRVEPSLQAAFLDYGGNRHGFLAFSEIHPDYYQIPLEERHKVEERNNDEPKDDRPKKNPTSRRVSRKKSPQNLAENSGITTDSDKIVSDVVASDNESSTLIEEQNENTNAIENLDGEHDDSVKEVIDFETSDDEPLVRKQHRKFRIQEVIKVRQILLIQVVKDERGNKGAALTTYLSLAGRYCVLMPNTPRGGGISRKITNLSDRKRLKEIANSLAVPEGSGLIVRTAGSKRTKIEIKRDYEYLIRQWEQVRDLTLSSIAPTAIYEEGSLIKRAIRDLYSRDIEEVLVEGDRGYKEAKDYMKMLMPSHAKNVKRYENEIPLFSKFEVEDHLAAMFNPIAQLKSGGYIVINVTEALVAVDVNSGRATKESSIEDTALKTNLEAADELTRQIKLRDLAGLIVVDFIDMEDRKNNLSVERRMKDRLKNDRARTQVGRISIFGLLEMSRQRLRPGMIETSTQPCPHCHGTGITRSDDSLSIAILRALEEEGIKRIYNILNVKTPLSIANYMLNDKRDRVSAIESRYNLSIRVQADSTLISPEYKIERLKAMDKAQNLSQLKNDNSLKNENTNLNEADTNLQSTDLIEENENSDGTLKKRRRRRRRPKQRTQTVLSPSEVETKTSREIKPETAKLEENNGEKEKGPRKKSKVRKEKASSKHNKIINTNTEDIAEHIKETSLEPEKATKPKKATSRKPKKVKEKKSGDLSALENNDDKEMVSPSNSESTVQKAKRKGWWTKQKID